MRIPEKKIKDTFTRAHQQTDDLSNTLEDLEEAICDGNYPKASERFGVVLKLVSDYLQDTVEEDIARLCDAINPAVTIHDRAKEAEKLGAELNEQLTQLQIGLDYEDAEAVTGAFDKAFDAAVRIREIDEDDVSVLLEDRPRL